VAQKFDQEKTRYLIRQLRRHGAYQEKLGLKEADEAADLLEDLMMAIYGIQSKMEFEEQGEKK
jgi:hypothetical protein